MRNVARVISATCFVLAFANGCLLGQSNATISAILNPDVVSVTHWTVSGSDDRLLCVVSERRVANGSSVPVRTLTVYRQKGLDLSVLHHFETQDSILSAYPLGDLDPRLFVTWVGGSAYHFRVLAYIDGGVRQVLDASSKLPPEIRYDEQGRESILVTQPEIKDGKWMPTDGTTQVFKWNGKAYDELGVVPWARRFECVSQRTCALVK